MTEEQLKNISSLPSLSDKAQDTTIEDIEKEVKNYLQTKMKAKDSLQNKEYWESLIKNYINEHVENWKVPLYVKEGKIDTITLQKDLIDKILNRGILEGPINDDKIDEIRGDDKYIIIVDNKNRQKFLIDEKTGLKATFKSPTEQKTILNKLLAQSKYDLNNEFKLVNGSTYEGYRISAVDASGIGQPKKDEEKGYSSFTLRKFRAESFTLPELIKGHTLSDNMGRLLRVIAPRFSFVTVGEVFSGKTTLNETLLNQVPDDIRLISVQNPMEKDLRRYDRNGQLANDVVIWEAEDDQTGETYKNTLENMLDHTLRNSPSIVSINEIRHNKEFYNTFIIGQTGHAINTTYHAGSAKEAISIFTNRLISITKQTYEVGLKDITFFLKFIIHQQLLADGTRKILSVTEVLGHEGTEPILNPLYEFQMTGEVIKDKRGTVKEIVGVHKQVGTLSDATMKVLNIKGISKDEMNFIQKNNTTEESYTGKI